MKKRTLSLVLVASMLVTTLTGCGKSGNSADASDSSTEAVTASDPIATAAEQLINHSDTAGKEETVYVIANADGETQKVIVSEWLKNEKGTDTLKDKSNLTDVKNVKGDEDFTKGSGDNLTWNANGSDIYYQGTSSQKLPVDVSVSYKLNGKPVKAEQLDGATGKLTIEFNYQNNTGKAKKINGKNVTIYQPFLMVSGLVMDNDKASNIEVTNGKVINSGDLSAVVGLAMPGLEESLGLGDLKDNDGKKIDLEVPKKVTITADVKDFSLLTTVTLAQNSALEELSLDDVDSVDDLKDSLEELGDASKQLVDGSKELADGVGELNDKSGDLSSGVDKLDKGAKDLNNGAKQVNDGAKDLDNGVKQVDSGAKELDNGAKQVNDGAKSLNDGAKQVNDGASKVAVGSNELASKVKDLPTAAEQLLNGAKNLKGALGSSSSQDQTIYTGAAAIEAGAKQISDSLKSNSGASIYEAAVGIQSGAATMETGAQQIASGINSASSTLGESINLLNQAVEQLETSDYSDIIKNIKTSIAYQQGIKDGLDGASANLQKIATGAQTISTYAGKIASGSEQLQTGAKQIQAGAQSICDGVDAMISGNNGQNLNTLIAGLSQLNEQSGQLVAGTEELAKGSNELVSGTSQLEKGTGTLSEGTDQLAQGTGTLSNGTSQLSDGSGKLAGGTGELLDGTNQLADGTGTLSEGTDKLIDGIGLLLDGSQELADGMMEFDEEGIQKLTDLMDADLSDLVDRLKAVQDYAEEYKSFGGCLDSMECTTKFIYKTDSIGE